MSQAYEITDHTYDVLVVGAGGAGLAAALAAQDHHLSCKVLEKEHLANTIVNFPQGKWVYAEPDSVPPKGKLWLDGATKEELVDRWHQIVNQNQLDVHLREPLAALTQKPDGTFIAQTDQAQYHARKIVLATGQRGNPRPLNVPGEQQEHVYHRLYAPRQYQNESILVVGGGNSAVEAALVLSEKNHVALSYRQAEFTRLFKDNRRRLDQARAQNRIELILNSTVQQFTPDAATLQITSNHQTTTRTIKTDHAFVLIGAEPPVKFLQSLGLRIENQWTGQPLRAAALALITLFGLGLFGRDFYLQPPLAQIVSSVGAIFALTAFAALIYSGRKRDRYAWLALSALIWYSVYGIKYGPGREFWPYRGWGYQALSFLDRPWAFWYTVLYTLLMLIFGLLALKRWGLDRRDRFQTDRYLTLIGCQIILFFLIPEFLFQWAVKYQWLPAALAQDPQFAEQAWRSYGLVYAWPLFFYTFFYDPHLIWIIWGVVLSFVIIPILVIFHGKRYCSWVCGCGGLAETFGDRWRHLAPKGPTARKAESMNLIVLAAAVLITLAMITRDTFTFLQRPADLGIYAYRIIADLWLVSIIPVALYPFLGGKIWCRYWCPLAVMMQLLSKLYARLGISRFAIHPNEKCIACYECSRNCLVGIDVMNYALKQEKLDNATSSCIGCGICVTVCPMDCLSFKPQPSGQPDHPAP